MISISNSHKINSLLITDTVNTMLCLKIVLGLKNHSWSSRLKNSKTYLNSNKKIISSIYLRFILQSLSHFKNASLWENCKNSLGIELLIVLIQIIHFKNYPLLVISKIKFIYINFYISFFILYF